MPPKKKTKKSQDVELSVDVSYQNQSKKKKKQGQDKEQEAPLTTTEDLINQDYQVDNDGGIFDAAPSEVAPDESRLKKKKTRRKLPGAQTSKSRNNAASEMGESLGKAISGQNLSKVRPGSEQDFMDSYPIEDPEIGFDDVPNVSKNRFQKQGSEPDFDLDQSALSQKKLIENQSNFSRGTKQPVQKEQYYDSDDEYTGQQEIKKGLGYSDNITDADLAPGPSKFQKNPYQNITSGRKPTAYINMVICHSISKDDELNYFKFMRKIQDELKKDKSDAIGIRLVKLFGDKKFHEVKECTFMKQFRESFNEALAFAIEAKRDNIAFDLTSFARSHTFQMTIKDEEIQLLVKNRMFQLIEDLVNAHTFILIQPGEVDLEGRIHDILKTFNRPSNAIIEEEDEYEDEEDVDQYPIKQTQVNDEGSPTQNDIPDDAVFEGGGGIDTGSPTDKKQGSRQKKRQDSELGLPPKIQNDKNTPRREKPSLNKPQNTLEEGLISVSYNEPAQENTGKTDRRNIDGIFHQDSPQQIESYKSNPPALNTYNEGLQDVLGARKFVSTSNSGPKQGAQQQEQIQEKDELDLDQVMKDLNINENNSQTATDVQLTETVVGNPQSQDAMKKPKQVKTVDPTTASQKEQEVRMLEKYLQISDFIEYILDNRDIFLEEHLEGVKSEEEEKLVVQTYLNDFLMSTQDAIDFDRTIRILIDQRLHVTIIDELFNQTDDSLKDFGDDGEPPDKLKSSRDKNLEEVELYKKFPRRMMLTELVNQSVLKKEYDVAYEVIKRFLSDFLKAKQLPIFEMLFLQFQEDPTRYEAKVALMMVAIPLMNRTLAFRLMKIIGEVIGAPAKDNILRNNINPLRTGLMLYRLINELQDKFKYSENTTNIMMEDLETSIVKMLNMYNDPEDLQEMVEFTDYEGQDCFWYLDEFDLYGILDSRIMDRIIQKKWQGAYDLNASILDYSTSYMCFEDKYKIFATDRVFSELNLEMCTLNRRDRVHQFKYQVWKYSMSLRQNIELFTTIAITIFYQIGMINYTKHFANARENSRTMYSYLNNNMQGSATALGPDLRSSYDDMIDSLNFVLLPSYLNLLVPLTWLMEFTLTRFTQRKPAEIGGDFINEGALFALTIAIQVQLANLGTNPDPTNRLIQPDFTFKQTQAAGIIQYALQSNRSPMEYLLTFLSFNTWCKLLFRMRITEVFGPQFKVIQMMLSDLTIFFAFWFVILFMFSSSGVLLFGTLDDYEDFITVSFMYFESSLGNWDLSIYCQNGNNLGFDCILGKTWMTVFLSVNMVLLLNLIIAILSSTYALYEDKKKGLYYEVLVKKFATLEFDEMYGASACAQLPLNAMVFPIWWITLLPCISDEFLLSYNEFLCYCLYFPISIFITSIFVVVNVIMVPIAWLSHTWALFATIIANDETMDEFEEKLQRFFTVIQFFLIGFPYLLVSIPLDIVVFYYNLFTVPEEVYKEERVIFSEDSLFKFNLSLDESLKERRKNEPGARGTSVKFVDLNLLLQDKLEVMNQVHNLLFAGNSGDKFVVDEATGKQRISRKYLQGIQEFNLLKALVANSADKAGMVDTELLKALIDQVNLRKYMMNIEAKVSDLDIGKSEQEILDDSLFELSKTNPNAVESNIAEEGNILETIDEKLVHITENIENVLSEVKDSFESLNEKIDKLSQQK